MKTPSPDIGRLFRPRSVAVIGASGNPDKIGGKIVRNIRSSGFRGEVYPINPRGGEVQGYAVLPELDAAPEPIDVAVIAVPAARVLDAVKDCCRKKVAYALIISSGFAEIGKREEEAAIATYAREHGLRLLGPNMFGIFSAAGSINSTFGPEEIPAGGVAILSQSGALGLSMIGRTAMENLGLSVIVSLGNKADVSEVELLDYLRDDDGTRVVMIYLEGVKHGEELLRALKRIATRKPVVIIKSGRSNRGAAAAASHTGSLAGEDNVFEDLIRQCGGLRAESIGEAFDLCRFFSGAALAPCGETLIVTNGGGMGVLATDASEKYGLTLHDDGKGLRQRFSPVIPAYGSARNPVDLTGEATPDDYDRALSLAREIPDVRSVAALYCETAVLEPDALAEVFRKHFKGFREAGKSIVFSTMGGARTEAISAELRSDRIPVFGDVYDAIRCLGALNQYEKRKGLVDREPEPVVIDSPVMDRLAAGALEDGRHFLLPEENAAALEASGIPFPGRGLAHDLETALSIAENVGYPVVLKIASPDILHKTDVGGVVLDLRDGRELADAYEGLLGNVRRACPRAKIQGVEVAAMAPPGLEMIVGARRDPVFGPVVMAGLGGVYVEVFRDVAFRAAPLDGDAVRDMLAQLRAFPLLLGARGEERKDIDGLVDVILKLGETLSRCPRIDDIEINPVRVYDQGEGVLAVDARILLSSSI